jgi:subtilisin family serine protease
MSRLNRGRVLLVVLASLSLLAAGSAPARSSKPAEPTVEVVVTLEGAPLARASTAVRELAVTRRGKLDLRAPASDRYLARLDANQRAVEARIRAAIPRAYVRWRYAVVLNGMAVVVPESQADRLASVPGVAGVHASVRYRSRLDRGPAQIGAPTLWGPGLATAGNGIKIAVIDDGIDQSHQFFDPRGFAMPAGFPKGNTAFTTAKVIAARAFAPPGSTYPNAGLPFDPAESDHATHVAGIAAGNNGVAATTFPGRPALSGVAPRAYLGNYKVLTIPTPRVGLDGNSPEIVAGIEAAVRDGMDVINLSLGEPEIEPTRDIVVAAINGAADAGVVPAIAAGNDFGDFGRGSIGSPGTAAKAITAAAVSNSRGGPSDVVASFSSGGPTPISLQLKPDVAAPGLNVLSSVPDRSGSWAIFSGTSMASPHVAGAAALLRQRHPTWTVAQIKSALVLTGRPAFADSQRDSEAPVTREGGGVIDLARANDPKVFAAPSSIGFGLLRRGARAARTIELSDAGGGTGSWTVSLARQTQAAGATVTAPATVTVPGRLELSVAASAQAAEREVMGFVVLARGSDRLRVPWWFRVTAPRLSRHRATPLARTGTYRGNTRGRPALVTTYRYPEDPSSAGVPTTLAGPEHVFRLRLRRPVANFGVAVISQAGGVAIQPRIVVAGDENRLAGYTTLPLNMNPYTQGFGRPEPTAAVLRPAPGVYDIVFDSTTRARAGRFAFRFWIDDATPPSVRLATPAVRGSFLRLSVTDRGSGVDPRALTVAVDGVSRPLRYARSSGLATVDVTGVRAGRHTVAVDAADYQETKNNENVLRILPNTRRFRGTFTMP